ncbi:MAG: hypothetical protein VZR09_01030 [Candidatus Gastranaerophilaceae bacterium]|nr:hypothetical protein [Candidatus Gastranaerophilaceae bacterium]
MIQPVKIYSNNIGFASNKIADEEELKKHPVLIENTLSNRMAIGWDKFTNAITMYPARGLKGSKNSNFYEFLTMGIIPYLTGSATLMAVFNAYGSYSAADKAGAAKFGKKMALGVLFYGLAKNISKDFVTKPVKWFTGVDTEEPYAEMKYKLPENVNDTNITSLEYHKVLESLEFPRWDVKYGDEAAGEERNIWFDKIARKIGLGDNLKDSDQDVKPRVKEITVKTDLAKVFASYLWAGVGVGLALQNTWDKFFDMATAKFWHVKPFYNTVVKFGECLLSSCKELYNGPKDETRYLYKNSGKLLVGASVLTTALGVANALISRHKPSKLDSNDVIEKGGKYVVN